MPRYLSLILFFKLVWGQIDDPFYDPNFPNDFSYPLNYFEKEIIINDSIKIFYNYDTETILLNINIKLNSIVDVELNTEPLKNNFVIKSSPVHSTEIEWINSKMYIEKTITLSLSPINNDLKLFSPSFEIIIDNNTVEIKPITLLFTHENKVNVRNLEKYGDRWFKPDEEKPFTGLVFGLSENSGEIILNYDMKNGQKHGLYEEFNSKGLIKTRGEFIRDRKNGMWENFVYRANKKSSYSEINYKNDVNEEEKRIFWYDNGYKYKVEHYRDGKLQGPFTVWYENGKKMHEDFYDNGKENGLFTSWYESGKIKSKESYRDGKLQGPFTVWYENGKKMHEDFYDNGKENGLFTSWYESGKIKSKESYRDGKLHGLLTAWFENGNKLHEVNYENGRGILKNQWNESGKKCYPRDNYSIHQNTNIENVKPKICIVIGHLGYRDDEVFEGFINLKSKLTFAVVPGYPHSREQSQIINEAGYELLVHMPMENNRKNIGEEDYRLLTYMSIEKMWEKLDNAFIENPYAIGMINHQGSRYLKSLRDMKSFSIELNQLNKFLVIHNIYTTDYEAEYLHTPFGISDIFLDMENDFQAITNEMINLSEIAKKNGFAIGIGHVKSKTLEVLKKQIPILEKQGFYFDFVSSILRQP